MSSNLNLIENIQKENKKFQDIIVDYENALNTQTLDMSVLKFLTNSKTLHRLLLKQSKPLVKRLNEKRYKRLIKDNNIQDKDSIEFNLRMIYAGYPYLALKRLNKIVSNQGESKEKRLKALYHLGKFHINGTLGSLGDTVADDLGLAIPALIKSFKSGNMDAGYWIGRIEEQLINYPSAIKIYQDLGSKNNLLCKERLNYIQNNKTLNENIKGFTKKR